MSRELRVSVEAMCNDEDAIIDYFCAAGPRHNNCQAAEHDRDRISAALRTVCAIMEEMTNGK